ncbi:MAG: hypothetical protein QM784_06805 [Polyangiaceae bacterium]
MNALLLEGVEHAPLRLGTRRFEPGLHVIRTLDSLAHEKLLALLSGAELPERGRVLLGERAPYADRCVRARIGSLWPDERLTGGRTFRDGLERLGCSTERKRRALECVETLSDPNLVDRPTKEMTPNDRRVLALALALTTEDPLALVLHEPMSAPFPERRAMVLEKLLAHGNSIPVIVFAASATLANALGGASYELDAGLLRTVVTPPSLATRLRIRGVGLRALVSELARNKSRNTTRPWERIRRDGIRFPRHHRRSTGFPRGRAHCRRNRHARPLLRIMGASPMTISTGLPRSNLEPRNIHGDILELARRCKLTPHAMTVYLAVSIVSAIVFRRRDPLTAWDSFLSLHFGLLLPLVSFALAVALPHRNGTQSSRDEQLARFGANRRALLSKRYVELLVLGALLTLSPLVWGRALTFPNVATNVARDGLICVGIGLLATAAYISFLGAMAHAGGPWASAAALFYDLTMGHSRGVWAALSPHRYVAELLGSADVFIFNPYASSYVLGGILVSSAAWIFFRTRP